MLTPIEYEVINRTALLAAEGAESTKAGAVRRLLLGLHVLGHVEVSGDNFVVSQLICMG